ncbi:pantoate--beta-alanine ligase [Galenea microaerophila]
MLHFSEILPLQQQVLAWKKQGAKVGFVPTMGNLHEGHLSLVERAKQQADKIVASVFVNPLQFGPNEDFDQYPRTLDADAEKLQQIGCDALFAPSVQEMYPEGDLQTRVCAAPSLANRLEGALRPGHFDGVTTVVAKLFHIVQPDLAVFGQKDFQQYLVIEKMVSDLSFPIQLIRAPIARAADGLALSSRNQYLTPEQRAIAPKLYQTLQALSARLKGLKSFDEDMIEKQLQAAQQALLTAGFDQVDYLQLLDAKTLEPCESLTQGAVLLAVARLGKTRLLDNILINID